MEDEPISETYSSIISEFIIIGIDKISHAQRSSFFSKAIDFFI